MSDSDRRNMLDEMAKIETQLDELWRQQQALRVAYRELRERRDELHEELGSPTPASGGSCGK